MKCKVAFGNVVLQAELLNKLVQPDPADQYMDETCFRQNLSPRAQDHLRIEVDDAHRYMLWRYHPQGSGFFVGRRSMPAMFIVGGRNSIPAFVRSLYVAGQSVGIAWNQRANGLSLQYAREPSHWYSTSTRSIVQIAAFSDTHSVAGLGRGKFIEGSSLFAEPTTGTHRGITFENLAAEMTHWIDSNFRG